MASDYETRWCALEFAEQEASNTGGPISLARAKEFEDYLMGKSNTPKDATTDVVTWVALGDAVFGPRGGTITVTDNSKPLIERHRIAIKLARWLNDEGVS